MSILRRLRSHTCRPDPTRAAATLLAALVAASAIAAAAYAAKPTGAGGSRGAAASSTTTTASSELATSTTSAPTSTAAVTSSQTTTPSTITTSGSATDERRRKPRRDTAAPTAPGNVRVDARTVTSLTVAWDAAGDNVGVIAYEIYVDGSKVVSTPNLSFAVSGLACGTVYRVGVSAVDAAFNRSDPAAAMVSGTTAACSTPDTGAPSAPAGVRTSSVAQTGVTVTWDAATDDVGVAGYEVYVDGRKVGSTASLTWSVGSLTCGTAYRVGVSAFDAASNRSDPAAATVSVTTAACSTGSGTTGTTTAALRVATTGSDTTCVRGDPTRPCASLGRAYRLAQCGDTVDVGGGTYGPQVVRDDGLKGACTSYVTFRPAAGAAVTIGQVDIGDSGVGNGADWIELEQMRIVVRANIWQGARNVRLEGLDGGSFYIQGAENVLLTRNDWGPCASSAGGGCQGLQNFVDATYGEGYRTANVVIDGDTFHDYTITPGSGAHFECLFVTGAQGALTIRNSRFFNCETYGIYFTGYLASHGYSNASITVENNWFGRTCCFGTANRDSAINLGGSGAVNVRNLLIRFNSFAPGQTVVREGGPTGAGIRVVANVLGAPGCVPDATYSDNVFIGSGTCGTGGRTATSSLYVDSSSGPAGDYRLSGVAGSTPADDWVTLATGDAALASDKDGNARNAPRDAGADER